MPRFVILSHDWPEPHLDLLLERDGVLKAWRLPIDFDPYRETVAVRNFDHRLHYLDYEGPLSDTRGHVTRQNAGEMEWLAVSEHVMIVRLHGATTRGVFVLRQVTGDEWRWAASPAGEVPPGDGDLPILERQALQ